MSCRPRRRRIFASHATTRGGGHEIGAERAAGRYYGGELRRVEAGDGPAALSGILFVVRDIVRFHLLLLEHLDPERHVQQRPPLYYNSRRSTHRDVILSV